jgi:hypothetical protein
MCQISVQMHRTTKSFRYFTMCPANPTFLGESLLAMTNDPVSKNSRGCLMLDGYFLASWDGQPSERVTFK